MGFFDKVKGALTPPDHAAIIQERLGDEPVLAHAPVIASAAESGGSRASSHGLTGLAQNAAHRLTDSVVENRHIAGEDGSVARSLPRTEAPVVLALGGDSVTVWEFGLGAKKTAPELIARIPRAQVTSIAATGKRKARGHVRLTFTDGSFFDYQTVSAPSDAFWTAADGFGVN